MRGLAHILYSGALAVGWGQGTSSDLLLPVLYLDTRAIQLFISHSYVKYHCLVFSSLSRRCTHPSEAACTVWFWWASCGTAASPRRGFAADGNLDPRNLDSRCAAEFSQPGPCSSAILLMPAVQYQVIGSALHSPAKNTESFPGTPVLPLFLQTLSRCNV